MSIGRWTAWKGPISSKSPQEEPTKTTEMVFDVFVGTLQGKISIIGPGPAAGPDSPIFSKSPKGEPSKTTKTLADVHPDRVRIPHHRWRMDEIRRQCNEYLSTLPQPDGDDLADDQGCAAIPAPVQSYYLYDSHSKGANPMSQPKSNTTLQARLQRALKPRCNTQAAAPGRSLQGHLLAMWANR